MVGTPDPRPSDPEPDPVSVARTICLRLLSARARTRAELAEALAKRNVPATAATEVLNRFTEVGLVDDANFAAAFVASRVGDRGLSRQEIERQLKDRGVNPQIAAQALERVSPEQELAAAESLIRRKARAMNHLEPAVKKRRLVGMLARRGYPAELACECVQRVVLEADADGEQF